MIGNKKYNIIYADPPWSYDSKWGNGVAEHHYTTMTTEDIKNLPIKKFSAEECHLYLWVTNPFLKEGIEVCESWGFEYKTLITWLKKYKSGEPIMGMGYYFRGCTEHIIFGVKGKMKIQNKNTRNFFSSIRPDNHSEKPIGTRDLIVSSSGDLPRIELFARQRTEGWDVWGNEVPTEYQVTLIKF